MKLSQHLLPVFKSNFSLNNMCYICYQSRISVVLASLQIAIHFSQSTTFQLCYFYTEVNISYYDTEYVHARLAELNSNRSI